jgi:curli biogenesis system outer membrane secretion channel CsgG
MEVSTLGRKYLTFLVLLIITIILTTSIYGAGQLYRIAVLPFDDRSIHNRWWGSHYEVGKGVSSELVTALLETKQFRLVEREEVDRVLAEQKFSATTVDPGTAAELGKILGVKYLVMGHVTEFTIDSRGGSFIHPNSIFGLAVRSSTARVAIDARMVDATTAEIAFGVTGIGEKKQANLGIISPNGEMSFFGREFYKTGLGQALRDAVTSVAAQLAEKSFSATVYTPLSGLVAYTDPTSVIINLGSISGVEPGMTFIVEHIIQVVKDPVTDEVIHEISEQVAEITVVEVKEKASICKIVSRQGEIFTNDKVKSK